MLRIPVSILTNSLQPMNNDLLKVGVVSLDIAFADKQANLLRVKTILEEWGSKVDVLVLPELFSTSFVSDTETLAEIAEGDNGSTIKTLRALAREYDVLLSGSYIALIEGAYFNRGFMLAPDGEARFYNKRHLFGLSEESLLFKAGNDRPPVMNYRGWNVAMIVCYDLRFPVWCRRHDDHCQYDLMLVVANWPQSREYAWNHLLIARAIENQSYLVGDNRSGSDRYGEYDGMSVVYDMGGYPIGEAVSNEMYIATLSLSRLQQSRERWPIARDADNFKTL